MSRLIFLSALVWTATAGCQDRPRTLNVMVTAADGLPAINRVVIVATSNGHMASLTVAEAGGSPVVLPRSIRLTVPSFPNGEALLEATAYDQSQTMVARGTAHPVLPASTVIVVELRCQTLACSKTAGDGGAVDGVASDGGADVGAAVGPDGAAAASASCGNGRLEQGETCDTARSAELPGACPPTCDDGLACTHDLRDGDQCTVTCEHVEVTGRLPGDGCCPAHADHGTDSDCSPTCGNQHVDPGEACDTAITAGPGACPNVAACDDNDPCTEDLLISAGTCSARCTHRIIRAAPGRDGCCPLAGDAISDGDCPAACGNGIVEPGERCDTRIVSGPGLCPTLAGCDDGIACTDDSLRGVGCQAYCVHEPITTPIAGDGCCPVPGPGSGLPTLTRNIDSDCPAVCGNGVLEAGEACEPSLTDPANGGCPTSCPAPAIACVRYVIQGAVTTCSAACVALPTANCSVVADGCCPTGCTRAVDPDCSATCGNGRVDPGETCDTAIVSGAGACPHSCADGLPCTDDLLVDSETCNARCVSTPTSTVRNGDGCCAPGAHAGTDADCVPGCGNGVVETPWETCDTATVPASCSATCPPPETCAAWVRTTTNGCDVRCTRTPVTACASGDGCCPPGCNTATDADCVAACGNGIIEPPETCDRGITAGHPGACVAACADGDACTVDVARGSGDSCTRACSHVRITACGGGDHCCPAGCNAATDSDCSPSCGDGRVQAGETCDPASSCPTNCPSDGDSCTVDQLVGSASSCNAACAHIPILRCSGSQHDGCCPTQCSTVSDSDC